MQQLEIPMASVDDSQDGPLRTVLPRRRRNNRDRKIHSGFVCLLGRRNRPELET
jgi:hypothetical protein